MNLNQKRLKPAANVLVRDLEGELVLLNLVSESYFGLDEVGARMWTVLTESHSLAEALATLTAEYEVAASDLEADLRALISSLRDAGLAELHDA
jgi:hypothetical protein